MVQVGAQSTSMAHHLANKFPTLHLIVQIDRSRASKLNPDYLWPGEMMNGLARDFTPQPESSPRPGSASSSRVTVTYRSAGMPQPVVDAAVYILHVPVLSTGADGMDTVKTELQDYLGILRATGGILLIPTANLLPEPGSLSDPNSEAVARTRDLNYLQLANEGEMEMTDLFSAIDTTRDGLGRLVITNQLRSHNGLTVCLTLKHETYC